MTSMPVNAKRKAARRMSEIPPDVLAALNAGEMETANLVEFLALDQRALLERALERAGAARLREDIEARISLLPKPTAMSLVRTIGQALAQHVPIKNSPRSTFGKLSRHRSDVVRCWAAFIPSGNPGLDLAAKLAAMRPFATDPHFGVREIAWMAIRPAIAEQLEPAIEILALWALELESGLRRCASEATRPRGVWCSHIEPLKADPSLALPILDPLKADPSKYVRDSVGNWLNDASKTAPDWVASLCRRWSKSSRTSETAYIVNKATRTLRKELA